MASSETGFLVVLPLNSWCLTRMSDDGRDQQLYGNQYTRCPFSPTIELMVSYPHDRSWPRSASARQPINKGYLAKVQGSRA